MLFLAIIIASISSAPQVYSQSNEVITLGTRPYYLVDEMKPSALKDKLGKFRQTLLTRVIATFYRMT